METLAVAIITVALIMFAAFNLMLRHQRRALIHKERLAALEKGVELPPLEQETRRMSWNTQQLLLLAGLVWMSIGIGAFIVLQAVIISQTRMGVPEGMTPVPGGLQFIGVAPVLIGLSHVIVYLVARRKDS